MSTVTSRWSLWHYAGLLLGTGMRALPKRFRFRAAIQIARVASLVVGRTDRYKRTKLSVETLAEHTLSHVLNMMTRSGTLFDLELDVDGLEDLKVAIGRGQGVFIAAMHSSLNTLLIRQLYDIKCQPLVIAIDTGMRIPGTRISSGNSAPSDGFMLRVRSWMRAGGVACAMVDRNKPARRTIVVETPAGHLYLSDALFRVAEGANAAVMFVHVRLQDGKVKMAIRKAIEDVTSRPVQTLTQHFGNFVQTHVLGPG